MSPPLLDGKPAIASGTPGTTDPVGQSLRQRSSQRGLGSEWNTRATGRCRTAGYGRLRLEDLARTTASLLFQPPQRSQSFVNRPSMRLAVTRCTRSIVAIPRTAHAKSHLAGSVGRPNS
jgi:hypothetical protein